ncbi:MAG: prepilin-type N-terminal cleavage/methylation domain-containing protein [Pseudomonadota bacterium]
MRTSATGRATEAGFSLLELLVVLSVIGLLSGLGATLVGGRGQRQAMREALGVSEFLRHARGAAQLSGSRRQVLLEADGLALAGRDGARLRTAPPRLLDGGTAIDFYPDGSSSGGVLALAGADTRVVVEWGGLVHVAP